MVPFSANIKSKHVIKISPETSITPILIFDFGLLCVDGGIKLLLRKELTSGLYNSIVRAALSPPLRRLKGRNAGISISATTSRG